jgi:hypothetical protein
MLLHPFGEGAIQVNDLTFCFKPLFFDVIKQYEGSAGYNYTSYCIEQPACYQQTKNKHDKQAYNNNELVFLRIVHSNKVMSKEARVKRLSY